MVIQVIAKEASAVWTATGSCLIDFIGEDCVVNVKPDAHGRYVIVDDPHMVGGVLDRGSVDADPAAVTVFIVMTG